MKLKNIDFVFAFMIYVKVDRVIILSEIGECVCMRKKNENALKCILGMLFCGALMREWV